MNTQYRIDENDPDFQALQAAVASWNISKDNGQRMDTGETATITRQLLAVKAKTYDVKYPMFKARDFIPVSNEIPSGAETWSFWQYDMYGMAKVIANYATDFPKVDVLKKEFTLKIQSLGSSYSYTVQDMRRISMMGQGAGSLDVKRASAARRSIEAAIDDIAAVGSTDAGLTGFINNSNVPVATLPTGAWATSTALGMIGDLNYLVQTVITQSNQVEIPDTLILPIAAFAIATQTPYSTLADRTVATWFMANNPYINNMDQWVKLTLANAGATGDRIVCYRRDPEAVTLEIPQEFEQFQPQVEGMAYQVPCHARIGGVAFFYPLSAAYGDTP